MNDLKFDKAMEFVLIVITTSLEEIMLFWEWFRLTSKHHLSFPQKYDIKKWHHDAVSLESQEYEIKLPVPWTSKFRMDGEYLDLIKICNSRRYILFLFGVH